MRGKGGDCKTYKGQNTTKGGGREVVSNTKGRIGDKWLKRAYRPHYAIIHVS